MKPEKSAKRRILLIDDSAPFIENFAYFTRDVFEVVSATGGAEAISLLRLEDPDLVLLDMCFNNGETGLQILQKIKQIDLEIPVIIITDFPQVDNAVQAMRMGAEFYSAKTGDLQTLRAIIEQEIRNLPWRRLYREEQSRKFGALLGESASMQALRKEIDRSAKVDYPVLIQGESGTGKELVANAIHQQSRRAGQALFTVNCSTLAPHLFESEFFGHERGAFTGAHARKKGKYELADHGTLFLDEIGELPLESQPKLLRALEYQRFQRVGGEIELHADVRLLAATNKDLQHAIAERKFREDLYYRLNALVIRLAPLRERAEDVPELVQHFLELACRELKRPVPTIPRSVLQSWKAYSWPGNVRELKHKMMQVALYTEGDTVGLEHAMSPASAESITTCYQELLSKPYAEAKQALLERFQTDYIRQALKNNKDNISRTAEEIGVHRSTVHRVLASTKLPPQNVTPSV